MIVCENENPNELLKMYLREDKRNLLEITHKLFWNSLFIDTYKLIGFNKCKSSTKGFSYYRVNECIDHFLVELGKKYKLRTTMQKTASGTEYSLSLCHLNEEYFSDSIIIHIGIAAIELRMLSGLFIENYFLEDFEKMEQLISDVCNELYENGKMSELLYEHMRIDQSDLGLTPKTVEIAQNSIRAIFNGKAKSFCYLEQKYLYSVLYFRGKKIQILHKEFLEMPEEVMKEFKEL